MTIQELRDIVDFIRKYRSGENAALDPEKLSAEKTKSSQFYKILSESKISGDEEAAFTIYNDSHSGTKYQRLKSGFLASSLNAIPFLNLARPDISDFTRAVFKAYKNLFSISVLLRLGSRKGAISLAKKTLILAERYELHNVGIELLEQLRMHAYLDGKITEYEKYLERLQRKIALLESETRIKTSEQRVMIHFSRSIYLDETLLAPASEALGNTLAELQEYDTYANRMVKYRLEYIYYQLQGRPQESAAACESAIAYMKTKPHLSPPVRFAEFELFKLENFLLARDYENGLLAAARCRMMTEPGDSTWFQYQEYHFILLMQTMKFHEARIVFDEVSGNMRFPSQFEHIKERWRIFGLYLDYATDSLNRKMKRSHLLRQNRYKKIIKDFPSYSKDKRGFNVAILVLNILLLLETDKKDLLIEQFEALSTYRFSHLKAKNCRESAILFKLIRLMVNNEFDLSKISAKALPLEKELADAIPTIGEITNGVQIIPPEWIWNRMKAALGGKSGV